MCTSLPPPQLREINCTLQNAVAEKKSCMVGCDVARVQRNSIGINRRGYSRLEKITEKTGIRSTAKAIAACRMQLPKNQLKNLRGGLRCAKRGWQPKVCSRLGSGTKPATPPTPHPQPPQNQLQLAECSCRKSCDAPPFASLLRIPQLCKKNCKEIISRNPF